MIYYDKFETWERSFGHLVVNLVGQNLAEVLASSNFDYVEDAGDFVVRHVGSTTVSTQIHDWLRTNEFCVFHGTRLLPEEILSVKQKGLRPLVAADREQRLRKILEPHPQWSVVQDKLREVLEDVGPNRTQGLREGQVHFSLSRSGLVNDFNHYLTYGSEFDQHVVQRLFGNQSGLQLLNSQTLPILVHVRMTGEELIQGAHPFFSYYDVVGMGDIPGLARTFLNTWAFKAMKPSFDVATLRTDCCMMQSVATPPERIFDIENLDELPAH